MKLLRVLVVRDQENPCARPIITLSACAPDSVDAAPSQHT